VTLENYERKPKKYDIKRINGKYLKNSGVFDDESIDFNDIFHDFSTL